MIPKSLKMMNGYQELSDSQNDEMDVRTTNRDSLIGTILINISVIGFSLSQLLAKFVYERHAISPLEYIATREIVSIAILIVSVNFRLKHFLWDSVRKDQF
jgi:hypothetical protein